jgi:poly(hydroxyalkanoate) depolymerase family esterase
MLHCNSNYCSAAKGLFMRHFRDALAHIQSYRGKFEKLLTVARTTAELRTPPRDGGTPELQEITGFGSNPGNLRMFVHVPERMAASAPLVVALHGCTQSAEDYSIGTGWTSLADRLGFAVLYPQQQPANNPKNCFSWFLPHAIARDGGEAQSIRQMIEHAVARFGLDSRQVFVTGLSAGGAMAVAMLAAYPEVFAGGAIIAGLPYGSARNVQQAFDAMFTERSTAAATLGDRVRAASGHRDRWPKISIWHGTADPIVKPSNAEEIIRQWTNLHGLAASPSYEEAIGPHRRQVWNDSDGEALIESWSINGIGHGVPLASGAGAEDGNAGAFFLEAGISSTHHIAQFWQLDEGSVVLPRVVERRPEPVQRDTGSRELTVPTADVALAKDTITGLTGQAALKPAPLFDPGAVIAAAFKAAGLPAPEFGKTPGVAPGPIIDAALRAVRKARK